MRRISLGVAPPLAVVALAYALWWTSDQLLSIGPFDRATFGWGVVIPVWLAAPVVAAFAWRELTPGQQDRAALLFGGVVAAAAAVLLWRATAVPNCDPGVPTQTPIGWLPPIVIIGALIGGGLAASGRIAAPVAGEGQRVRAVIVGAGLELLFVFATILVGGFWLVSSPACQRPVP